MDVIVNGLSNALKYEAQPQAITAYIHYLYVLLPQNIIRLAMVKHI